MTLTLGAWELPIVPPTAIYGVASTSSSNNTSVTAWVQKVGNNYELDAWRVMQSKLFPSAVGVRIYVTAGQVSSPSVAMDKQGDFVVTWTQTLGSPKLTQSYIVGRMFSASGAATGNAFIIAGGPQHPASDSHVAADGAGNFVVTYTQYGSPATKNDIIAKLYDSGGAPKKSINVAVSTGNEQSSSVAMTSDGRFDIAYEVVKSSTNHDIDVSRYSNSGAPLAKNAIGIATSSKNETAPSVSVDDTGAAVVAYRVQTAGEDLIQAARVSTKGKVGSAITITSYTVALTPAVAVERSGGAFVVAYVIAPSQSGDFFIPHVFVTEVGANDQVNASAMVGAVGESLYNPEISFDGSTHFLVSTASHNGSKSSPIAQFGRA
jgi:hypothetical protein